MAQNKTAAALAVPAALALLIAIAAKASVPLLIELTMLLPVAAAMLQYYAGWPGTAAVCAAAGLACGFTLPAEMLPVIVLWCGGSLLAAAVPVRKPLIRPILWAAVCLVTWLAGLLALSAATDGKIIAGLARGACDYIDASPERNSILINAYSMGLARLNDIELLSARRIPGYGYLFLEEETRRQMLYSLRVSLEELLPSALCSTMIYHTVLTTLLCTVLPDWRRRRQGEEGLLPPMEKWYMPRRMGTAVFALLIGWVIALVSDDGVMGYVGMLCMGVFRAAFMLQGACFLLWMGKRMGIRNVMRGVWAVALSLLAPVVPIIMGVIDQRKDARHLRPNKEAEQE